MKLVEELSKTTDLPFVIGLHLEKSSCPKCKQMDELFTDIRLDEELCGKFEFFKEDIIKHGDILAEYNVTQAPFYLMVKDGEVVSTFSGLMAKKLLKSKIETELLS